MLLSFSIWWFISDSLINDCLSLKISFGLSHKIIFFLNFQNIIYKVTWYTWSMVPAQFNFDCSNFRFLSVIGMILWVEFFSWSFVLLLVILNFPGLFYDDANSMMFCLFSMFWIFKAMFLSEKSNLRSYTFMPLVISSFRGLKLF